MAVEDLCIVNDTGAASQTFDQAGFNDVTMLDDSVVLDANYTIDNVGNEIDCSAIGRYLVIYTISVTATGAAGSNRRGLNFRILIDSVAQNFGFSSLYVRESGGSDDESATGAAFVDTDAADEGIQIEYDRSDDQNPASVDVDSIANGSSLQILQVDDAHNYGFFRFSGTAFSVSENTESSGSLPVDPDVDLTWTVCTLDTTDEADTGFSRSGNVITCPKKHLLVLYGAHFVNPANRANGLLRVTLDNGEVLEAYASAYVRNSNGHADAWANGMCIIDASGAADGDLRLEACTEQESTSGQLQIDQTYLQVLELPDGADYAHFRTSANFTNFGTTPTAIDYPTEVELDTGSFGHPTNSEMRLLTSGEDYLLFSGWFATKDSADTNRKTPETRWHRNAVFDAWGIFSSFVRGDQGSTSTWTGAQSGAYMRRTAAANEDIENRVLTHDGAGAEGLQFPSTYAWMQGINIPGWLAPAAGVDVIVPLGTFALAEQVPAVGTGVSVDAPAGTFTLVGQVPNISTGVGIGVPAGTFTLAGQVPTVASGAAVGVPLDAFTLAGQVPVVGSGASVAIPLETFILSGPVPAVGTGALVTTPLKAFSLSVQVPTVETGVAVAPPLGTFTLSGQIPVVVSGGGANVPLAAFSLAGQVPGIASGGGANIPLGVFSLGALVPAIDTGVSVDIPLNGLTLTGFIPTIEASGADPGPARRRRSRDKGDPF